MLTTKIVSWIYDRDMDSPLQAVWVYVNILILKLLFLVYAFNYSLNSLLNFILFLIFFSYTPHTTLRTPHFAFSEQLLRINKQLNQFSISI